MRLYDDAGITYDIDPAALSELLDNQDTNQPATEDIARDDAYLERYQDSRRQGRDEGSYLTPTEAQLKTFLHASDIPADVKNLFWSINYLLAITKIANEQDYAAAMLEVENLIRVADLAGEKINLVNQDQLMFYAANELRRSRTYDGQPNERYLWVLRDTRYSGQADETAGGTVVQPPKKGILGALFGR